MRKPAKLLLGAATAWQLVYALLFTRSLFRLATASLAADPDAAALAHPLDPALLVHAGTGVLMVALAAWYVADAARSPRVPANRRALWVALNVVGGFLAQLPYWWAFVWREPEPLPTTLVTPSS